MDEMLVLAQGLKKIRTLGDDTLGGDVRPAQHHRQADCLNNM